VGARVRRINMHRTNTFIIGCLLLVACAACARDGKAPAGAANTSSNGANPSSNHNAGAAGLKTPPADIVRAETSGAEIAAGGAAEAIVRLMITEGYHIGANPATLSYQIATQVNVEPSEGITAGQPVYPPSIMKKFSFEPEPFAVYEGEAVIKVPLRAEASAAQGTHALRTRVRVQACDDQACYPPRTINTSLPVTVK
jgi:DsbC/DsbD-like thiol-disulfide interchange protein